MSWSVVILDRGGYQIVDSKGEVRGNYKTIQMGTVHHALALEELDKLRAENETLKESVVEHLVDIVHGRGFRVKVGAKAGWWCHQCAGSARAAFRELVRLGVWKYHPIDESYARPKEKR